jgi:hypothetical protein
MASMPSAKLVLAGGAGAAAVVGIRLARTLHWRWRALPPGDKERIAPLAEDARHRALELRGADDLERAASELRAANETLAAALVESAEADPELDAIEVKRLRDDLRRELERLASGEVEASGPAHSRSQA